MRTIINATDFSDCTPQDFNHYFSGTMFIWTLPNTSSKRRAFLVGEVGSSDEAGSGYVVKGQYLTKLKEWKTKSIKFANWHKVLQPISIRDMFFRCGKGVSLYQPNLSRAHGALKKSIRWNYQGFTHFGSPSSEDVSTQGFTWWAFRDLYDHTATADRSLADILLAPAPGLDAEVTARGFIVDRIGAVNPKIYHRGKKLGTYDEKTRTVVPVKGFEQWGQFMYQVECIQASGIQFKGAA